MSTARTPAAFLGCEFQNGVVLQVRLLDGVFEIQQVVMVVEFPDFARCRNDMEMVERSFDDVLEVVVFLEVVRVVARQGLHDQTNMMLVMVMLLVMLVFRFFIHCRLQENIVARAMTIACSPYGRTDVEHAIGEL